MRWSFDLRYHPTGQASGRAVQPECIVRSRANPAQEQLDPAQWAAAWIETRDRLAAATSLPPANRWSASAAQFA